MVILGGGLKKLRNFSRSRAGNLTILGALAMPVGLVSVGMALDLASMIATKSKLQAAADAGAVAAAAALVNDDATEDEAKELAKSFIRGQLSNELLAIEDPNAESGQSTYDFDQCTDVTVTPTTGYGNSITYDVTVNTCLEMQLTALNVLLGHSSETVDVSSSAQSTTATQNAMSMYLVLDRSGSMGWDTDTVTGTQTVWVKCGYKRYCQEEQTTYLSKIDALKNAAGELLDVINSADPDGLYARLAAVSYNSAMQTPQDFSWGTSAVTTYVNNLTATGGTDSSYAVKEAYMSLHDSTEDTAHAAKNGQTPDKYIVFMTDGDNNYSSADTATKGWCDDAKAAGIEIYTIAFMAPDGGKALLSYCATDADHYFAAENAEEMSAAFTYIGEKAMDATTRLTN